MSERRSPVKLALCPAVSVTGGVIPLSVKPVPLIPTCETVTDELPTLVTVCDSGRLVPVCTVPKFKLAGFAPSVPVPDGGCVCRLVGTEPLTANHSSQANKNHGKRACSVAFRNTVSLKAFHRMAGKQQRL